MTIKETLKKHSTKTKKVVVAVALVGTVATVASLYYAADRNKLMLVAAIDVIKDLGGDAPELISEKVVKTMLQKSI